LRLSPAYGPLLVWRGLDSGFGVGQRAEFWQNVDLTFCWSTVILSTAVLALKRLWQEREGESTTTGWHKLWRDFMHGGRETRRRLANFWLYPNPFVWLAGRDRQPATLGWLVVSGIVLAWLFCWAAWPAQWPSAQNFFVTATLLNTTVAWITRHTAAQALAQARRDGAYEFLLTTPLDPRDIVRGTLEALRWHFQRLANIVLTLNVLMMLGGLVARRWNERALIVYFSVWLFLLAWTWSLGHRMSRVLPVMWASLNSGRPAHAVWRTSNFNGGSWIWILFNLQSLGRGFQQFPSGSKFELVMVLFCSVVLLIRLVWLGSIRAGRVRELKWNPETMSWTGGARAICETRLISEFREIVREPLPDPSDPRFKKWNVRERFPWGWELVQQQLHERLARR
jgi:hypothetical protein